MSANSSAKLAQVLRVVALAKALGQRPPELAKASLIKKRIMHTVYILECSDGQTYTGCTKNLNERINRHKKGYIPATKSRRPVKLATHIVFSDKYKAFEFEKYLKTGSGRAFLKRHLI